MSADLAATVMQRIEALAQISEEAGRLTRTYGSMAMLRANELVGSWMREAGMAVRQDAVGNLIGHYPAAKPGRKILLLGSHLDTVRDAGKFDGPLGILTVIACVQSLNEKNSRLPFAVEVIGFADEEGARFQSTYLGSRALAGTFDLADLKRTDAKGISMAQAIRDFGGDPEAIASAKLDASRLLGYAEVHIEQGPLLERQDLAVGVVTAIAGQSRIKVTFTGEAGHAGTVPMPLRHDALCAAAEFVLAVETFARSEEGLVATVGEIVASPGASNVIPGQVRLSLDLRHAQDAVRQRSCDSLKMYAEENAAERGVIVNWEMVQEIDAVACDRRLTDSLEEAVKPHQRQALRLTSGAGHDAATMAVITPVTLLFVRCRGGISHHPAETVTTDDLRVAIAVMNDFLQALARAETT